MTGLNSIRPIYARGGGAFTIKQTLSYMIIVHILIIYVQIADIRHLCLKLLA